MLASQIRKTRLGFIVFGTALTALIATPAMSMEQFGDWFYSVDAQKSNAFTMTRGNQPNGSIAIICNISGKNLYFAYSPESNIGKGDDHDITYKIDNAKPVTERWTLVDVVVANVDRESVKALANKMMAGNQLIMNTYDNDFNAIHHTFFLNGTSKAISRVLKSCGE